MALCGLAAVLLAVVFSGTHYAVEEQDFFYTAAVYEHKVHLNPDPKVTVGRKVALQHMYRNLEVFEKQATSAAQQVKIISVGDAALCFRTDQSAAGQKLIAHFDYSGLGVRLG